MMSSSEDEMDPAVLPDSNELLDANGGAYENRHNERDRLRRLPHYNGWHFQAEHVYGYRVVHNVVRDSPRGQTLEAAMPAYLEQTDLHQEHAGSGYGRSGLTERGWPSDDAYRTDQKATLFDGVAEGEATSISNGYQLNQLGYGHQIAELRTQGGLIVSLSAEIKLATNSFVHTVTYDPPVNFVSDDGESRSLHLGPRGQTEAVLARETAVTGRWPTRHREQEVYRHFLRAYFEKKDKEVESRQPGANDAEPIAGPSKIRRHRLTSHTAEVQQETWNTGDDGVAQEINSRTAADDGRAEDERVLSAVELQETTSEADRAFWTEWYVDSDGHMHPRSDNEGHFSRSDNDFWNTDDEDAALADGLQAIELEDRAQEEAIGAYEAQGIYREIVGPTSEDKQALVDTERQAQDDVDATDADVDSVYEDARSQMGDEPSEHSLEASLPIAGTQLGRNTASGLTDRMRTRQSDHHGNHEPDDAYEADSEMHSTRRAALDQRSRERSLSR